MAGETTMTYGAYSFSPVPTISVSRSNTQVKNRTNPIGFTYEMTLTGTLITEDPYGIIALDTLQHSLRSGFNRDGKKFEIKCGEAIILTTYPRIKSLEIGESNNNWVISAPYTIVIEYDVEDFIEDLDGGLPPYIESYNEEWQMEFDQDYKHFLSFNSESNHTFRARVTRNISVVGKQSWAGPGTLGTMTTGAANALSWLNTVLADYSYDSSSYGHSIAGFNNLPTTGYGLYDHYRTHTVNETDGSVSLVETWLVIGDGDHQAAIEDFTISVRKSLEDARVTVGVEGTIQGLEVRDYGTIGGGLNDPVSSGGTAYENAEDAWAQVKTRLYDRAAVIATSELSSTLNPVATSRTVGHNPSKGTINYNYEFDNRPCSFIPGSLSENIGINNSFPTDVFAELVVPGRPQGPVLQDINTPTKSTREVIIEAVMPVPTGCDIASLNTNKPVSAVEDLLGLFETELTDAYDQVFKHADTDNWNPLTGRYSRTVGWTFVNCETSPTTSFNG